MTIKIENNIDSAVFQLTAWYLVLIMLVSLGFSVILFQMYNTEFSRGLGRQGTLFRELPSDSLPDFERLKQLQIAESTENLRRRLGLFNLGSLVLGGAAAYLLARRTLKPIQESIEAQDRFIADASHELRTPLAAMRAEIEVGMRDKSLDLGEAKQLLDSNLEEVARLESLSNSLLKLTVANTSEENRNANLLETVKNAISSIQKLAADKSVTIKNNITDDVAVKFDQQELVELMTILLDNAIKYSPAESIVEISQRTKDHRVALTVSDQGQGIRASDIPHIFDRFFRADQSRSSQQTSGYGLGLAIAKKLADANNAQISVQSVIDKGTTFTVTMHVNS